MIIGLWGILCYKCSKEPQKSDQLMSISAPILGVGGCLSAKMTGARAWVGVRVTGNADLGLGLAVEDSASV